MDIDQFVTILVSSGLSNKREAEEFVSDFRDDCNKRNASETVEAFCDYLIATGLFTEYQCGKLRAGKWKGFYLDNYLLLEQVGKGVDYSSYKARDTRNGNLVCLVVTPVTLTDGRIEYRVEPYIE